MATGFMEASETKPLFEDLAVKVSESLNGEHDLNGQPDKLRAKVRETAREFIFVETRRRPIIIPVVLEV